MGILFLVHNFFCIELIDKILKLNSQMLEFYINFWSSLRLFMMTKDRCKKRGHVTHWCIGMSLALLFGKMKLRVWVRFPVVADHFTLPSSFKIPEGEDRNL
jgi:hypothetical protein